MARLEAIRRLLVKGLSSEDLDEIDLLAGRGIPQDREYALALADTEFDESNPRPLPKTKFAVLARFARLAALQSRLEPRRSRSPAGRWSRSATSKPITVATRSSGRYITSSELSLVGNPASSKALAIALLTSAFTLRFSWKQSPSSTWRQYARSKKSL